MSAVLDKQAVIPAQLPGEFKTLLAKTFSSEPQWLKEKRKAVDFSRKGQPNIGNATGQRFGSSGF